MPERMLAALALTAAGASLIAPVAPAAHAGPVGPPANGFARERVFSASNDDWEPAIAADAAGHVHLLTTRYVAPGRPAGPALPLHRHADPGGLGGRPQLHRARRDPVHARPMIGMLREGRS